MPLISLPGELLDFVQADTYNVHTYICEVVALCAIQTLISYPIHLKIVARYCRGKISGTTLAGIKMDCWNGQGTKCFNPNSYNPYKSACLYADHHY